jgi:hypothetical protein
MDFPAPCICIKKEMEQSLGSEKACEGREPGLRLPQMVKHTHGIDVIEGSFISQIQQAPLLLP